MIFSVSSAVAYDNQQEGGDGWEFGWEWGWEGSVQAHWG